MEHFIFELNVFCHLSLKESRNQNKTTFYLFVLFDGLDFAVHKKIVTAKEPLNFPCLYSDSRT